MCMQALPPPLRLNGERLQAFVGRALRPRRVLVIEGHHSVVDELFHSHPGHLSDEADAIYEALLPLAKSVRRLSTTQLTRRHRYRCFDLAVVCARGEFGDDGRLQGFLDYHHLPYAGSGMETCVRCADKWLFKQMLNEYQLRTPASFVLSDVDSLTRQIEQAIALGYPVMCKPRYGGGSLGIVQAQDWHEVIRAVSQLMSRGYLIEQYIEGVPITLALIQCPEGLCYLPPVAFDVQDAIYTTHQKLNQTRQTDFRLARLPEHTMRQLLSIGQRAYQRFACRSLVTLDFVVKQGEAPYLLDMNPYPRLDSGGIVAYMFAQCGYSYQDMACELVRSSSDVWW